MIAVKARAAAMKQEHRARAWQAWHTAALPNTKRFPSLAELLGEEAERPKAQTPEEMKAALMAWTQVLGGTVTEH